MQGEHLASVIQESIFGAESVENIQEHRIQACMVGIRIQACRVGMIVIIVIVIVRGEGGELRDITH